MIYEAVNPASPISQGDIFTGIPCVEVPPDCVNVPQEDGQFRRLRWEDFALPPGEECNALLPVRSVVAIVGNQDCDARRSVDLTLFEIRPFHKVEGKANPKTSDKGWVSILTQHARINQKWFYLPPSAQCEFAEKMGVDFQLSLRVPRVALEKMIDRRKARLNEIALDHFRERISEFFRRYSYDEWYALNLSEFEIYRKNYPDDPPEPFQWQRPKS
jgi:hypothetical protein